jgi:hypothetical protein
MATTDGALYVQISVGKVRYNWQYEIFVKTTLTGECFLRRTLQFFSYSCTYSLCSPYVTRVERWRQFTYIGRYSVPVLNETKLYKDVCGSGNISPHILNPGDRWKWMVRSAPGFLPPPPPEGKSPGCLRRKGLCGLGHQYEILGKIFTPSGYRIKIPQSSGS